MTELVTGVDFVTVPSRDLERAATFYRDLLGLPQSVYRPQSGFSEYEAGNVTLSVVDPVRVGMEYHRNTNPIALHVADVAAARAELESAGVTFFGDIVDTGVCHMAFFADPDDNPLMLHHRYAPRTPDAA